MTSQEIKDDYQTTTEEKDLRLSIKVLKNSIKDTTTLNSKICLEQRLEALQRQLARR